LQPCCLFLHSNIPHKPCLTHFGCVLRRDILRGYESGESNWPYILNCKIIKSSLLQQMPLDHLQAVCQPTGIRGNPSAHLLTTRNGVNSVNVSFRLFMTSDGVISPVHIWAKLPIGVQSILPAHFWVIAAHSWVKLCPACSRVTLYATHEQVPAHLQVNFFAACSQVKLYPACLWVTLYAPCSHVPAHVRVNLFAAHLWMKLYPAHLQAKLCPVRSWVALYATHSWVPACLWVNLFAAHLQVILYTTPLQMLACICG